MKPRQTVKNYLNSNTSLSAQQQQQPPQQQHHQNQHYQNSSQTFKDTELAARLGLNLDDMSSSQPSATNSGSISVANPASQEELLRCLQAMYGKNSSADIIQKLPVFAGWPPQSISPSEYSRSSAVPITASNNGGLIGGPNPGSFGNNNSLANLATGHRQTSQDISKFSSNSQHPHQTMNQNFRLSKSSLHPPQQQQLSQQKSVLSLHQHHQSDLSNRRLNYHNMSATNASFANFNAAASASTNASTSTAVSSLDTNILVSTTPSGNISKNSAAVPKNIMETIGSLDNIFYDGGSVQSTASVIKETPTSNQHSLIKHQQLQKLLKATNSQARSSSSPSSLLPPNKNDFQPNNSTNSSAIMVQGSQNPKASSTASATTPSQTPFSSVPKSLLNLAACSSSPSAGSTSTSSSKFSSMVNQLNLKTRSGAGGNLASIVNSCNTSNTPTTTSTSSSSLTNTSTRSSTRNLSSNTSDVNPCVDEFNQKNHLSLIEVGGNFGNSVNRNPVPATISNTGATARSSKQYQWSLLSEDQTPTTSRPNLRSSTNTSTATSSKNALQANQKQSSDQYSKEYLFDFQDKVAKTGLNVSIGETSSSQTGQKSTPSSCSKDYLLGIQKRAAKIGVNLSITESGELPQPAIQMSSGNSNSILAQQKHQQQQISCLTPNKTKDDLGTVVDTKEIESALSRVEARNDLSLLYPPMLLASNSQKKINALSAGLQVGEDSELFTKEVKKIILEECNVIYECKACNNLFRSLANLVKHKRTYCLEHYSERSGVELNKRSCSNNLGVDEQSPLNITIAPVINHQENMTDLDHEDNVLSASFVENNNSQRELGMNVQNYGSASPRVSSRHQSGYESRAGQSVKDTDKKHSRSHAAGRSKWNVDSPSNATPLATQPSLSRILQSQPKSRLPIMGPLSVPSGITLNDHGHYNSDSSLNALENDKNQVYSSHVDHEQLVKNSSLAKTLLNEKVRGTNPRQSLIELSKVLSGDSIPQVPTKRVTAPKRKFLEDCIQKVKRDKLLTEDDESHKQCSPVTSNSDVKSVTRSQHQKLSSEPSARLDDRCSTVSHDLLKLDSPVNSETESDALMIDVDTPAKKHSYVKKAKRRVSNTASSTASSSTSVKLNTSSALLKALTRPVDVTKRSSFSATSSFQEREKSPHNMQDPSAEEQPPKDLNLEEENCQTEAPSPLFDKYTCDICEVDHADMVSLIDHTAEVHRNERMVYPCIFCSFSFTTLENACRHIIDIHKKPKVQVQRLKEVVRSRAFISSDFLGCNDKSNLNPKLSPPYQNNESDSEEPESECPEYDDNLPLKVDDKEESMPVESPAKSAPQESSPSCSDKFDSDPKNPLSDQNNESDSDTEDSESESIEYDDNLPLEVDDKEESLPGDSQAKSTSLNSSPSCSDKPKPKSKISHPSQKSDSESDSEDSESEGAEYDDNSPLEVDDKEESAQEESQENSASHNSPSSSSDKSESEPKNSPPNQTNESDSDSDESGSEGPDYDDNSPLEVDDKEESEPVDSPEKSSQKSSSSKSATDSGQSSNSGGGSGGIMKLKIQLKTRSDEKSKVYEIV